MTAFIDLPAHEQIAWDMFRGSSSVLAAFDWPVGVLH